MISEYGNAREAMRMATVVANLANEGRAWDEIYHVTGISFDIYQPGTINADQRYPIAHLGTIRNREDVVISRADENSRWTPTIGGLVLSDIRKTREKAMSAPTATLNAYRTVKAAERDAKRVQLLANEGKNWTHIRRELEMEIAVFAPGTLWPEQTEEVAFLGKVNDMTEILIVRPQGEKEWQIRVVQ